ncbi:hypothetical protein AB1Y20_014873 [Prymnesium parvum]|uniref:Uncharacterized protein n=1 Tax=Prymnesium parvum TaxID=97485 RepID=A0AB34JWS7_PRYPA
MQRYLDLDDLLGLPREFFETFRPSNIRAKNYPLWTLKGDTNAFFALFFDNLATQLNLVGIAVSFGFTPGFVYHHFMGGVGASLLFGNLYYSLQASKVAMRTGKMDTCAQPYGINTPGALGKSFNVLLPAFLAALAAECGGSSASSCSAAALERAMFKGWSAACAANFLGGMIEFAGAFLVTLLFKTVPYGAMLVPIGGVGFTWLGYGPIANIFGSHSAHFPIVGMIPFLIIFLSFFASDQVTGPFPSILVAALVGIVLYGVVDLEGYGNNLLDAKEFVGEGGIQFPDLSYGFSQLSNSASLVAAFAFTNFIGTYACNIQARVGGDVFSPMESMMVDGLGSMIGGLLGSPYGTTVYIGHTTYKKFGATRGYSLLNGVVYFVMGMTGLHGMLNAVLPHEIVLGVLVCIGFTIASQCVEVVPRRWIPAVMIGLAIAWSDYMVVNGADNTFGAGNDIAILGASYVWVAMFWTFALMMLIDRWFVSATVIFLIMAALTSCGVMHSAQISFEYVDGHQVGAPPDTTKTWKLIVTYGAAAGVMLVYALLQKCGYAPAAEEEDFRELQAEKYSSKPAHSAGRSALSSKQRVPELAGDSLNLFDMRRDPVI